MARTGRTYRTPEGGIRKRNFTTLTTVAKGHRAPGTARRSASRLEELDKGYPLANKGTYISLDAKMARGTALEGMYEPQPPATSGRKKKSK